MRSPILSVRSLLLAACGLSSLVAAGCGGGSSQPVFPPHMDIPIAPAPTATHANTAGDPQAAPKSNQ
jgi:hypothetical protein